MMRDFVDILVYSSFMIDIYYFVWFPKEGLNLNFWLFTLLIIIKDICIAIYHKRRKNSEKLEN